MWQVQKIHNYFVNVATQSHFLQRLCLNSLDSTHSSWGHSCYENLHIHFSNTSISKDVTHTFLRRLTSCTDMKPCIPSLRVHVGMTQQTNALDSLHVLPSIHPSCMLYISFTKSLVSITSVAKQACLL